VVAEARLGELIETLWDHRPDPVDPLVVRVFVEALRVLARSGHAERLLAEERAEQEAFHWQVSHLAALQPLLRDYVEESVAPLCAAVAQVPAAQQRDCLAALEDLRAEAAAAVLPLLSQPRFVHAELALNVLSWSRDPRVAPWLRNWAHRRVQPDRRAQYRLRPLAPRRPSVPPDIPYRALLRALRGQASKETENFLLLAARDWDPTYRAAALGSLGWWEPFDSPFVVHALQEGRRDPNAEVRQRARAALARLGERQALHWFRQALTGENHQRVHESIQLVASEGLTLLWPDLDRMADHDDLEIALHAREALERLREELGRSLP
jgi:hypothetical protein